LTALGIVVLTVVVGGFLISYLNRVDNGYEALRDTGVPTAAHVADLHSLGKLLWWSIEYTHEGADYRGSVRCNEYCFERGERITVYVDRDDPSRFLAESGQNSVSTADYVFGLVIVLAFVVFFAAAYLIRSLIVDRAGDQPTTRFFQGRDIDWPTYVPRVLGATALLVGAVFVRSWWLAGAGLAVILASGILERRRRARAHNGASSQ
jgi:hypothetical protein